MDSMHQPYIFKKIIVILFFITLISCGGSSGSDEGNSGNQLNPGSTDNSNSLRFFGNGTNDIDRVKILIDDPATTTTGPPADIGAEDFTIEFWMKADADDNQASAITCGENYNWITGNIIVDRDRYNQSGSYGISLSNRRIVFGLSTVAGLSYTLCATSDVLDNNWHHIAIVRRVIDGYIWIFIDGFLEAEANGPDGDISYPDDGVPGDFCDGPCVNSDPYLVLGAEKHDAGPAYPAYNGLLDEFRLSNTLRYTSEFPRPVDEFIPDTSTMLLLNFNEGAGLTANDTAPGGLGDGGLNVGGMPQGPIWTVDVPF